MRTQEKQLMNIADARGFHRDAVTEAIRTSGYGEADRETMTRIVNAKDTWEALRLYEKADSATGEYLQDIIEETIYGRTQGQIEELEKRYQTAIARIGGAEVLANLPGPLKTILKTTADLKDKTELMEAIAEIKAM